MAKQYNIVYFYFIQPSEPKSGGHMTITHLRFASIIGVFRIIVFCLDLIKDSGMTMF